MAERGKPKNRDIPQDQGSQSADYIAQLTDELAKLARRSQLDLLAYLLDIASLEARITAEQIRAALAHDEKARAADAVQG